MGHERSFATWKKSEKLTEVGIEIENINLTHDLHTLSYNEFQVPKSWFYFT